MKEIAFHILDIAENGIRAGAGNIAITIVEEGNPATLKIRVEDDGKGMGDKELSRVGDPFYTSRNTRRVGLGVPLLKQHAEMACGGVKIHSKQGEGTKVEATFLKDHLDRQPLGDLEGCWMLLATSNPRIEWELQMETPLGSFNISTLEIRSALGVEMISGNELRTQLKSMIRNSIDEFRLT